MPHGRNDEWHTVMNALQIRNRSINEHDAKHTSKGIRRKFNNANPGAPSHPRRREVTKVPVTRIIKCCCRRPVLQPCSPSLQYSERVRCGGVRATTHTRTQRPAMVLLHCAGVLELLQSRQGSHFRAGFCPMPVSSPQIAFYVASCAMLISVSPLHSRCPSLFTGETCP